VAAGLLCSVGTADAQFRYRSGYGYASPSYSYPTYSYPTYSYAAPMYSSYAAPTYYGSSVVTSGYTPLSSGVVTTSGYTPLSAPVYSGGSYYDPNVWNASPSVYGSSYYGSPYSSGYYGGYSNYNSGMYVAPSGGYVGGRRIFRW